MQYNLNNKNILISKKKKGQLVIIGNNLIQLLWLK